MISLQEMAGRALARGSGYPALEWQGREYVWSELSEVAQRVQELLRQTGAGSDAPIAMLPANTPGMTSALIGLLAEGRTIAMINVYQSAEGIAGAIEKLAPAAVIGMKQHMSLVVCDALASNGIAGISIDMMDAELVPNASRSAIVTDGRALPPQIQLLTSGTTGPPKHFTLAYDLILRDMVNVNTNAAAVGDAVRPQDLPPLYFYLNAGTITGLYLHVPTLLNGRRAYLVDRFTVETFRDYVRRHRPETIGLPMPAIQMILDADVPQSELASLKSITTGASPLDVDLHRAFEEKYGIHVLLVYGATEFGGPVAMMTSDMRREWGFAKLGSQGRAFNGSALRVVDPVSGAPLPPDEVGILEVRAERVGPDWIRTSDLFRIDGDGFIWFQGRADGAINRGGFKLMPEVIEAALRKHDAVDFVSVVGVPDHRLGEVPVAAVQLKEKWRGDAAEELDRHIRKHVEATHVPVAWRFVEAMPYTSTMKIDRGAVRRMFESEAAA